MGNNNHRDRLKIAFYGDDFTGATDTLSTAARAGLRALLFLGLPTPDQLDRAGVLDCLGIAGAARAMTPAEMQDELEPVGRLFAALGAPVTHYKTCSTFDSAPGVGSIGAALTALRRHLHNPFLPIVGGQPNLRRYCLFGNLFAGVGGAGPVSRIDRHPVMRCHPVTPMAEADLTCHLALQGLANVVSLDYTAYVDPDTTAEQHLGHLLEQQPDAVLMDVSRATDLPVIGRLIWQSAQRQPLLAAGASSVVQALAAYWQEIQQNEPQNRQQNQQLRQDAIAMDTGDGITSMASIAPLSAVFVLAGSLSPVTAAQVRAATSYCKVAIDAAKLVMQPAYGAQLADSIAALLLSDHPVLACIAPPVEGQAPRQAPDARLLAIASGKLLADILRQAPQKRIGVAGGDTSSHAVLALDAWGLSYIAQLDPGVALCRLHSDDAMLDGMEVMLKGGQVGRDDLFERLLHGAQGIQ